MIDAVGRRLFKQFCVGDLVSWKKLGGGMEYGFILKTYYEEMSEGRKFMFARVKKTDGTIENFMLSSLTKES